MKIITQISLLDDTQNENLGDLKWLQMVLDALPDEELIKKLEDKRGKGRDDWPVAAMWNSFVASFLFDHSSIASLIRELNRNKQLRMICGFQPHYCAVWEKDRGHKGKKKRKTKVVYAPSASAYTNFLDSLVAYQKELKDMFGILKVYYVAEDGAQIELICRGYDKNRDCQRYGFHVKYHDNRIFRIPLKTDPRIFTKVARNSKKWKRLYKKRTSIERINGRIDRDFQFEKHTIRGLGKMRMFVTVTLVLQLAAAKAKIEQGIYTGLCKHCA